MDATTFWQHVEGGDYTTCWLWTGARKGGQHGGGYGSLKFGGRTLTAHRVAYELLIGDIPAGLQLDHLCRVRHCVNPWHLEPVTNRVNVLRGIAPTAQHAQVTHCPEGHPFSGDNLDIVRLRSGRTFRRCRACKNAGSRAARARKAAAK